MREQFRPRAERIAGAMPILRLLDCASDEIDELLLGQRLDRCLGFKGINADR